jgi:steroid 5-alpha reductase family enzyme
LSGFATSDFLTGAAVSAVASAAVFTATWLLARRLGRWNVVDVTWGFSFAVIAAVSYGWSAPSAVHADATRRALVLALTVVWGLRLAGYIAWRSRGKGEDPRYAAIFERAGDRNRDVYALSVVFGPQAFLAWFVSLPVQVAMYERSAPAVVAVLGGLLWATGLFFEGVGDAQMSAFRSDPANRGQVMDRGLWHYTRHPNYFGDACVWFGLYLIAAQQWQGLLTVLSPFGMLYFLYFKSGKGLLEKGLSDSKPGYADYVARTSGFIPLPPRRR